MRDLVWTAAPLAAASMAAGIGPVIPMDTPVRIVTRAEVSSRNSRAGAIFPLALATPILDADGDVLLPAGTPGTGEVVHAARPGFGGRAGELVVAARHLDCGGVRIPIGHLHLFPAGRDATRGAGAIGAASAGAAALTPVAGAGAVLAFLVHGGNAAIPSGTIAEARTTGAVTLTPTQAAACASSPSSPGD